ncbi:MAG: hypothetical protein IJT01_12425 [Selenomonadaceae bacterium]|nr:hypothetical protein [Selenomonadaceae bacterium]
MNEKEQKAAAKAHAAKWNGKGDEKQHTQTFWLLQQAYQTLTAKEARA